MRASRPGRLVTQRHQRLFGCPVPLLVIAREARCHDVLPNVRATLSARPDVIHRVSHVAAVGADASVPGQHRPRGDRDAPAPRDGHVAPEPDNRRQDIVDVPGMSDVLALDYQIGFADLDQVKRSPCVGNVQRLIVCIQEQRSRDHPKVDLSVVGTAGLEPASRSF